MIKKETLQNFLSRPTRMVITFSDYNINKKYNQIEDILEIPSLNQQLWVVIQSKVS